MGGIGSGRKAKQPAEGGAVGGGEITPEVRGPIRDMLAGGSEDEFANSLPESTATEGEFSLEPPTKKRSHKRKPKQAEVEAPVDARLERAKSKAAGLGGSQLIETGFRLSGKPLDSTEKEDLDDQFYLIATKAGIDPSGSWLFVVLYTVALLARLILSRTELGEQLKAFLEGKTEGKEADAKQQK